MITTAPRNALPCEAETSSPTQRPRCVPPYRSVTFALARASATSAERCDSAGGQPGQRCREREDLGANSLLPQRCCPHEMQIDRRVRLHRSADVAHQHHSARVFPAAGTSQPHRLPARRARCPHRLPADRSACRAGAARGAGCVGAASAPRDLFQPLAQQAEVLGIESFKRLVRTRNDPARQRVGNTDVGGMALDGGDRRRVAWSRAGRLRRLQLARPGTPASISGGCSRALFEARRIHTEDGIGEDRLEHRIEGRQILDAVHQRQPRRPIQLRPRLRPVWRRASTNPAGPLAETTTPPACSRSTSATAKAARSTPRSRNGAVIASRAAPFARCAAVPA